MHERFDDHRGPPADEHIFMAGSAADHASLAGPGSKTATRVAAWDSLPEGRTAASITALRLFDRQAQQKDLPALLPSLHRLAYLSVPAHLIPRLTAAILPPSVRALLVETPKPATLAKGVVLPHIVRVTAAAPFSFQEDAFPAVEHLSDRLDAKHKMLSPIARLRGLRSLGIGPVSAPTIFTPLAALPALGLLGFSGGNLATLNGIESLVTVTDVIAANFNKLSVVGALAKLPRLTELSFFYCPRLEGLDVLLKIKSLRRLEFIGCTDKSGAIEMVRARLEALGLDELRFA